MAVLPDSDGERDGIIRVAANAPGGLGDRGIGFQAAGFTVVLLVCTTVLRVFDGSEFWLYQWFDTAVTVTYWAAVAPLAALFDWGRKMFERGQAIREAKKAEIRAKGRAEGLAEGRAVGLELGIAQGRVEGRAEGIELAREREQERIRELLKSPGVTLPPEVAAAIFGDAPQNGA